MTKYDSPLNYPSCAHIELEKEQSTVTRIMIVINNHKKESKHNDSGTIVYDDRHVNKSKLHEATGRH